MYHVPLPIDELDLETIPDETGFTMPEKISLRNAWLTIAPKMEEHAKQFFLEFFTYHEGMLDAFRGEDHNFKMFALHKHAYSIFYTLEAIIFDGLEGLNQLHAIVSPFTISHRERNVASNDIAVLCEALGGYLKKVLERVLAPTLEKSIDKLCNFVSVRDRM